MNKPMCLLCCKRSPERIYFCRQCVQQKKKILGDLTFEARIRIVILLSKNGSNHLHPSMETNRSKQE